MNTVRFHGSWFYSFKGTGLVHFPTRGHFTAGLWEPPNTPGCQVSHQHCSVLQQKMPFETGAFLAKGSFTAYTLDKRQFHCSKSK